MKTQKLNISAIGFDLGKTLIDYPGVSLSWQSLYSRALQEMGWVLGRKLTKTEIQQGEEILSFYNTRQNPRVREISSKQIFSEILNRWGLHDDGLLPAIEVAFFTFFQKDGIVYLDALEFLADLTAHKTPIGILTDVPYGMGKKFLQRDISLLHPHILTVLSSEEVGYRKPHPAGFQLLAERLGCLPENMIFIGDEEKDIVGANKVGMVSVLINREGMDQDYGQQITVRKLTELRSFF